MPATTPPKGRPTPGRRDRTTATRRARSRSTTKRFLWALIAVAVIGAVLVIGSGSGGNAVDGTVNGLLTPLSGST